MSESPQFFTGTRKNTPWLAPLFSVLGVIALFMLPMLISSRVAAHEAAHGAAHGAAHEAAHGAAQGAQTGGTVAAAGETAPSPDDGAADVAIWIHPTEMISSTIIATDDNAGITVYELSGAELQFLDLGEVSNVDLRYNFPLGDETVTLVVAGMADEALLHAFTVDAESGTLTQLGELETESSTLWAVISPKKLKASPSTTPTTALAM